MLNFDPIEHSVRTGIPQVLVSNFELMRILAGHPNVVGGPPGGDAQYLVRLFTVDELMATNAAAIAKYFPDGGGPAPMSYAAAENLVRPVILP